MRYLFLLVALFLSAFINAQTVKLSGTVLDAVTGESLIGANITYAPGKGAVADLDGNFEFDLLPGSYEIHISFIGYNEFVQTVKLTSKPYHMEVLLDIIELDEVVIVADVARERSTPIAFSSVSEKQIAEEQGTQDLPLLLNYTPGVYATQSGGGDGDARINIRGFDQRNMAVMLDGIPVNDMENGWVYWSNWVLPVKTMQVQRGLSASKLALPSVGGTINIISIGIDAEPSINFVQDFASGNYTRSQLTLNTGRLKGDWGLVFVGSYKKGDGIIDQLYTEGFSYYVKAEKFMGKHRLSFMGAGAPQSHGQRKFKSEIPLYSTELAEQTGIADSVINEIPEMGILYNEFWGEYQSYDVIGNGTPSPLNPNVLSYEDSTITNQGSIQKQSIAENYYFKPIFSLRDFWQVNEKLVWVNTLYASYGWGGGTGLNSNSSVPYTSDQQRNLQSMYFGNRINTGLQGYDDTFRTIDTTISFTEYKGSNYIRSSVNNHNWYGALSQVTYKFNPRYTFSGGIDLRTYKGIHYREIYDLMGADYIIENSIDNIKGGPIKRVGDKVYYYDESLVRWAGFFTQLEYTNGLISAFLNITGSMSAYKGIDYYRSPQENGDPYQTDWQNFYGYTVKLGANYNLNENMNVFANVGYLNNAPKFNSVIDINNDLIEDAQYEKVMAAELGYAVSSRTISANVNGYVTKWDNRPINRFSNATFPEGGLVPELGPGEIVDPDLVTMFIPSMDALHMGIEFDAAWVFHPKWKLQFLFSLGDWTWQSQEQADLIYDSNYFIVDSLGNIMTESVDTKGVHVGDAAQFQVGGMLEFLPTKNSYVRARYTFFGKNYSNFDPGSVTGVNAGRESWEIPNYQLVDFFAGYRFKLNKGTLGFSLVVNNILNTLYISDAQNNDPFKRFTNTENFDAASATIFPGLPRRYSLSITLDL